MKYEDKDRPCEGYEETLVLYHYGELGPKEAGDAAAHIASCGACRAYMDGLLRTLDAVPAYAPGPGEAAEAYSVVMDRIAHGRRALNRKLIPAFVALTAFVFVLLFTVFRPMVFEKGPSPDQAVMAQADPEVLENLDLLKDLDTIEDLDTVQGIDELQEGGTT